MALMTRTAPANHRMVGPQSTDNLLSVRDLETRFFTRTGTVHAVNGVSFDLERGERMAIVGESGSGKSVMAMSLMRLVAAPGAHRQRRVMLDGRDVLELSSRDLRQLRGGRCRWSSRTR